MKNKQTVLVTGGAGYIGSHMVADLLKLDCNVVILDNLSNSKKDVVARIGQITERTPTLLVGDIQNKPFVRSVFDSHRFDAVIHFAGLKAVGESESDPLRYYENNLLGSICLFEEMARSGVKKIVFSSSATVYGDPGTDRYTELTPLRPINVYGRTKLMVEDVLRDLKAADDAWQIALLRYFNPVGAHVSGLIGEDPAGPPNNLVPFIAQVAAGKRQKLMVFGGDYPTKDGTGMRDYIHVSDLVAGHVSALNFLGNSKQLLTVNLGSGRPYSVLEMVKSFEVASGKEIPYEIVQRRPGDLACYYADPTLAKNVLNWEARYDIQRMCQDAWRWQLNCDMS